jgi:hypothetical protein
MLPAALAALGMTSVACGGREVEVISSTVTSTSTSATAPTSPSPAAPRQFRGTVERIDAANRAIVIGGTVVTVPPAATIRAATGQVLTFTDLHVGDVVSVTATVAAGAVTASAIVVETAARSTVTLTGRVAALSGNCPTVTFAVADTTVTATAATRVTGGACAQIVNGVDVQVTGTRQTDRSVVATDIALRGR